MAAPIRFLSGRNQQQKIGIEGSTENQKVLEVVGRVGIGTTIFEPTSELDVRGDINVSGVSTFTGAADFNGDLDVDGHTELDNVNVSGAITATTFTGNLAGTVNTAAQSNITSVGTLTGLDVNGHSELDNVNVSGAITATTFTGNVTGIASTATKLETSRNFSISGDFVTASSISFDGTGDVSLAATITTDSITLGTYTTGDYVDSISGTGNQITVTSGTGEGSTPVISIPNNPTLPGTTVTIANDLQVNRNLNVTGNITIGGTSATLFTETLRISDPDIILGFRTDANGNDVSNDTTANHGGVAVASTEGSPIVSLIGAGETLPVTYKKIMWFQSGAFTGLATDSWLTNYAFGVGTTSMSAGTKFAVGNIETDFDDITSVRHIYSSGIVTATDFVGGGSGLTGITASQVGALSGVIIREQGGSSLSSSVGDINFVSGNLTATASGVGATITLTNDPTFTSTVIGTGVTINSSGINAATGIITALEFFGDGSGLSGISGGTAFDENETTNQSQFIPFYVSTGTTDVAGVSTQSFVFNPSTKRLGIGTGTPISSLHVVGDAKVTGIITATTFDGDLTGNVNASSGVSTFSELKVDTDITMSAGIVTATTFSGTATTATNLASGANITEGTISDDRLPDLITSNINASSGVSTFTELKVGTAITMSAGIVTATTFVGNVTGTATTATNLASGANITEGTIDDARLPDLITSNINASSGVSTFTELKVDTDIIMSAGIITATTFVGNVTGTATTATNLASGANITEGTIDDARLPDLITSNINASSGVSTFTELKVGTAITMSAGIVTATTFVGSLTGDVTGTATTATNLASGANITEGTISDARLPDLITSNINASSGVSTFTELKVGTAITMSAGIVTATTFYGSLTGTASNATKAGIATYTAEWILESGDGSDYGISGPGLTGTENDPTFYVTRGEQYKFTNNTGGHPFRIQSTPNGSAGTSYNDGITNNDAGDGTTLLWNVQFDSPSVLYYQCTTGGHGGMGGKIYIGNSGQSITVDGNVGVGTTNASGAVLASNTSIVHAGIVTANYYYGDGANLTNLPAGGGDKYNTGITTSVYVSITGGIGTAQAGLTTVAANNDIFIGPGIGYSFPSTAGKSYVIESIHVTNIYNTNLYLTSRHDFNGGENVPTAQRVVIPYQGALEVLEEPIIAKPSDILRLQAFVGVGTTATGVNNGLDSFITYTEKDDANFIGIGKTVVTPAGTELFTSTTNPSVIQSIRLCNYNLDIDVDASVSIYRGGSVGGILTTGVRQGYLSYNLTVPKNSVIEILERPKYLPPNDTVVVGVAGTTLTNSLSSTLSGKYIT